MYIGEAKKKCRVHKKNKEKVKILICRRKKREREGWKEFSAGKVEGVDESFAGHEVVARLLSLSLPRQLT